jgi:glyoxylase-like metal-dependent hydrolase (beta-lactamase superfamily II)
MLRILSTAVLLLLASALQAQPALPRVGVAIVKTSQVAVLEALLVPGGSLTRQVDSNFSAFLVKHHNDYFLFDTGMGSQIDGQYRQDMPLWWRPFFKYDDPVRPARAQLQQAGLPPITRVILSHSHWDHAGGVQDFPEATVNVAAAELERIRQTSTGPGGTWASQIGAPSIRWEALQFAPVPYKGYAQSLDLYGDGSVVLVPMPGHTPGSIGLFVTVDSGAVYFFIGDVAWTVAALQAGAPKFWVAGKLVDGDAAQTRTSADQVRALLKAEPGLTVVPAHDSAVQGALGYFPRWVP